ncbi:hypothetical protein A3Q56_03302 [Intoshia linei]|uniref:Uncharacterized protein n=1 Tax=Intoshia linei TaxID=1819745 RepID=A0A177B3S5_9BILA|nr:hypothetical protein A3Q56_03302 [Intoshia linei]
MDIIDRRPSFQKILIELSNNAKDILKEHGK